MQSAGQRQSRQRRSQIIVFQRQGFADCRDKGRAQALDETLWVPNCPHGRPIALTLGEAELERRILRR